MRSTSKKSAKSRRSFGLELLEDRRMFAGLTVPELSSRPTAEIKLYLDFDGHNEGWGSPFSSGMFELDATTPPYSIDADTSCFSAQEIQNIYEIHQIVSEKFSLFEVDVTTIDPGSLDDGRAGKVVIGGNGDWYGTGGGVAQLGGFYDWKENVAFVWDEPADVRYVGETVAHQFGHMLGLRRKAIVDLSTDTILEEFAPGFIMGRGDIGTRGGRWSNGAISGVVGPANVFESFDGSDVYGFPQDDTSELIRAGLPYRAADHTGGPLSGTIMSSTLSGFASRGVAEDISLLDSFAFPVELGTPFEVRVEVDSLAPMFNPGELQLLDHTGNLVDSASTDSYGETIQVSSATSPMYHVLVFPGYANQAHNSGSYNVVMERMEMFTQGQTPASATFINGVDLAFEASETYGRHEESASSSFAGPFDWYRFHMPAGASAGRSIHARIENLVAGDANLHLLRDVDRNGAIEYGTSDLIASSFDSELGISVTDQVFIAHTYYLAVERSVPIPVYDLILNIDASSPGEPALLDSSGIRYFDYVGRLDSDAVSVPTDWREGSITRTVDFEFEPYDETAEIRMGYDSNGNDQLEPAEITLIETANRGETKTYDNIPTRDASRDLLIVEVHPFEAHSTNYRLEATVDELPIFDLDILPDASYQLGDLAGSRHGGFLEGLFLHEDDVDIIDLGSPSGGFMEVIVTPPANGGAKFQLVADFNFNGVIDPNEVVSEDTQFFVQSNPQQPVPHYLVANFDPGFADVVQYDVMYRDGLLLDPRGRTLENPLVLDGDQDGGSILGYVATSPVEQLDLNEAVHRLTVEERGTLLLNLVNERPVDPNDLPDAGIQVYRDFNQDGELEPDERLAGFGGRDVVRDLQVNVTPGEYFIMVVTAEPQVAYETERYVDFKLDYEMDGVIDESPVNVSWAALETDDVPGILVEFNDNVETTLGVGDIILRDADGNEYDWTGELYDREDELLFLGLPALPGGDHEMLIRKQSIADEFGNRMENDFVFAFEVASGDFNLDGEYTCTDINMLSAAVASGNHGLAFDLNGDGEVTFLDINDPQSGWLAVAGADSQVTGGNAFLFGDANLDGIVDISDFNLWNANKFTNSTDWCRGNFNGDDAIDISDFNQWNANKFSSSADSPSNSMMAWYRQVGKPVGDETVVDDTQDLSHRLKNSVGEDRSPQRNELLRVANFSPVVGSGQHWNRNKSNVTFDDRQTDDLVDEIFADTRWDG